MHGVRYSFRCASIVALSILAAGCANTQYAGLNTAEVVSPTGETWTVISGKDQTNTALDITRGDVTVHYSSAKEDASKALSLALQQQSAIIDKLVMFMENIRP